MDNPPPTTPMSPGDFARLDALEQQIVTAWDAAALALSEIKDAKLYRTTRDGKSQTWDEYCQCVHDITPQWANKLISRAAILQRLNAESETPVSLSPTAVGHLEGLSPQEQAEIVKSVTKDGQKPKAKDVADAKFEKLMGRLKSSGEKQSDRKGVEQSNTYLVTVVTPDKDDLKEFSKLLPSPITDFKAQSVSGWVATKDIPETLERIGQALATDQPKKVRVKVENG